MAHRRAAAAQQEDPSLLKLIMEKGPLSGQSITFKPETCIRIGRIVRGNTLPIKDPGISSKHLLIQIEPGRRRWTLLDLGSSNGTALNGVQVKPSEPTLLSDGDVVKIGETTVMTVKFESKGGESEDDVGNGRRDVRRGRKNQDMELGVIDEVSELWLEGNVSGGRYNLRAKRAKGKDGTLGSEGLKLVDECGAKIGGKRARGSKAKVLVKGDDEIEEEVKVENLGKLSLKSNKSLSEKRKLEDLGTNTHEFDCEVVELEDKEGRITNLRTRSSQKTDNILDDLKVTESMGLRVSVRRTRSSRMKETLGEIGMDSVVGDGRRTRKGVRGKHNLPVKTTAVEVKTEEEPKWEHEICEGNKGGLGTQVNNLVEESIKSGVKERDVACEKTVDMEKMTLGEWFDFLEEHLPKQIIDATEEMISAMEQNVRKLNKFMLQKEEGRIAHVFD